MQQPQPQLKPETIIVGKVGTVYGIKGWLKIHSFTEHAFSILQYNPWYLQDGSNTLVFQLEEGRQHGKGVVAKFAGIDTPEAARTLVGHGIAIQRQQLAPLSEHEYYWADLVGLRVIDQKGETLGQISYLIATGSNDVVVIRDKTGKEQGIPYLPGTVIKAIDLKQQVMYVDWDLI